MVLIYSDTTSPRLSYLLHYIFSHTLKTTFEHTTDLDFAKAHKGALINYSHHDLGGIHISPAKILFESNVHKVDMLYELQDGQHRLMLTNGESFPFDPFAAIFYCISRYEEYYHPKTDRHGRLLSETSMLGKHGLLKTPVVDLWVNELVDELNDRFKLKIQKPQFQSLSTIDLDNGFKYRAKGFKRTLGGFVNDLKELKLANFGLRLSTICGVRKDDYDIYDWLIAYHQDKKLPLHFFVLNARRSNHDRGLPKNSKGIRELVNKFENAEVGFGLHPSYSSNRNYMKVDSELEGLRSLSTSMVISSRQHFLKFTMPATFQHLIERGVTEDYSMGYAPVIGFRAGTCRTFPFYDLEKNEGTKLIMFPMTVMEGTFKDYLKMRPSQAIEEIGKMIDLVKEVGGTFISIWHEAQLAEGSSWKKIYLEMNERILSK